MAMNSRVAYYLVAFAMILLAHTMILPVKGQPTIWNCENEDSTSSMKAEANTEAIRELSLQLQNIRKLLAESNQERQRQQDIVTAILQAGDRRSQEQIQRIHELLNAPQEQNKTQHDIVLRRLEAIERRLDDNDICCKNQTQNSSTLAIGFSVQPENGADLGVDLDQLPIVNNWIILMNRSDLSMDFNRNWSEYKNGFGDIGQGEFWLGNEIVHRLTNRDGVTYTLRVEVQVDSSGRWFYANYATFSLDSENGKYALHLSGYSGNAGDSLTDTSVSKGHHNGRRFSTKDADNDRDSSGSCAQYWSAGWWFDSCWVSCLTCGHRSTFNWRQNHYETWQARGSLRAARMMFKSI